MSKVSRVIEVSGGIAYVFVLTPDCDLLLLPLETAMHKAYVVLLNMTLVPAFYIYGGLCVVCCSRWRVAVITTSSKVKQSMDGPEASLAICVPWIFPIFVHTNDDVYGLSTVVSMSESDQILLVPYLLPYYFLKFGIDMWPYVLSRF
jgi:hypothetical protein